MKECLFYLWPYFQHLELCLVFSKCLLLQRGNGTPLQYSCLENPMDGGAW